MNIHSQFHMHLFLYEQKRYSCYSKYKGIGTMSKNQILQETLNHEKNKIVHYLMVEIEKGRHSYSGSQYQNHPVKIFLSNTRR